MALEGSLDVFNLPEILQMVSVQKKTGILTVQGESDIVAVSFLNGQVVAADALNQTVEEGLGQVLAQMELVQPEDFAAVAAEHQAGGGRMVDLLQQRGYVERPQLLRALRTQTFGLLRQLLEWKRGDFKFYGGDEVSYEEGFEPIAVDEVLARATPGAATPGAAAPRAAAPATPAAPDGAVVVELPSEVSVYSRISPPPQRVRLLDESPGANLREGSGIWVSREEKLVLDRLDGKRSIAEIGRDLRIGAHRALRALERLAELGLASSADRGAAPAVAAPPAPRPAAKAAPPPAKVVPPCHSTSRRSRSPPPVARCRNPRRRELRCRPSRRLPSERWREGREQLRRPAAATPCAWTRSSSTPTASCARPGSTTPNRARRDHGRLPFRYRVRSPRPRPPPSRRGPGWRSPPVWSS